MRLLLYAGLCAIAILPRPAEARSYRAPLAFKGDPEAEMFDWARANIRDGELAKGVELHWIDFTNDSAPDALVSFASYAGGNAAGFHYILFRNECGRMVFYQDVDASGVDVAELQLTHNRVLTFATTIQAPGDAHCCWTGRQHWRVKLAPDVNDRSDGLRSSLCGNTPRPLAQRLEQARHFTESTPIALAPPSATVFSIFPRDTELRWASLPGAVTYAVEVEMFDTSIEAWVENPDRVLTDVVSATTYSFAFVGAQQGRWRVRGIDRLGRQSAFSPWWTFEHRR